MNGNQYPLISLCMIVRDEEKNIVNCLSSIKDYVDEIIVLDTGSNDWTPLLAREMGAKVLFADWKQDFSKARNISKQTAKGEWILFLDADEIISTQAAKKLRSLAAAPNVEGYYFNIINHTSLQKDGQIQVGLNVRMFRNKASYLFEGAIHEQIITSIKKNNPAAQIKHSGLEIIHYGYCVEDIKREEKNHRNIEILQRALQNDPQNPFYLYNLGVSYYKAGRLEEAKKQYQLAKGCISHSATFLPVFYRNFSICLCEMAEYVAALELVEEGIAHFPDYPELYFIKGQIYTDLNFFSEAVTCYLNCLKFEKAHDKYVNTVGVTNYLCYEQLADIYVQLNQPQQALRYQLRAIRTGASSMNSVLRLALIARQHFQSEKMLLKFLKRFLPDLSMDELIQILFNIACYELVLTEVAQHPAPLVDTLLITIQSCIHLKQWASAHQYIAQIPQSSKAYEFAQLLGCICCLLSKNKSKFKYYLSRIHPDYANDCKLIANNIIFNNGFKLSKLNYSTFLLDIIFQMLTYDQRFTIKMLEKNLAPPVQGTLCHKLALKCISKNNYILAQELLKTSLRLGNKTADTFNLYSEVALKLGNATEGVMAASLATRQQNTAAQYNTLLKGLVNFWWYGMLDIMAVFPDNHLLKQHWMALNSYRNKYLKGE